jgi:uncharacterized cupin superfamily protein
MLTDTQCPTNSFPSPSSKAQAMNSSLSPKTTTPPSQISTRRTPTSSSSHHSNIPSRSIKYTPSTNPTHLTSGFYKITAGPPKPAAYDFEETKYVLSGQIDVLDEATGITHHLVAGDFAFFYKGSKVKFSTKSEGMAFYAVTRPVRAEHGGLSGREDVTIKSSSKL